MLQFLVFLYSHKPESKKEKKNETANYRLNATKDDL
jgi:hypothetical protein